MILDFQYGPDVGDEGGAFIVNNPKTEGPRMFGIFEMVKFGKPDKKKINTFLFMPPLMEWIEVNNYILRKYLQSH